MTPPGAGSPLSVECSEEKSTPVVRLVGDLDISSVAHAHAALAGMPDAGPAGVVFDLGGLRFMDSSGIAFLLTALVRFGTVRLRDPSALVREVIEMTGLAESLPVE